MSLTCFAHRGLEVGLLEEMEADAGERPAVSYMRSMAMTADDLDPSLVLPAGILGLVTYSEDRPDARDGGLGPNIAARLQNRGPAAMLRPVHAVMEWYRL